MVLIRGVDTKNASPFAVTIRSRRVASGSRPSKSFLVRIENVELSCVQFNAINTCVRGPIPTIFTHPPTSPDWGADCLLVRKMSRRGSAPSWRSSSNLGSFAKFPVPSMSSVSCPVHRKDQRHAHSECDEERQHFPLPSGQYPHLEQRPTPRCDGHHIYAESPSFADGGARAVGWPVPRNFVQLCGAALRVHMVSHGTRICTATTCKNHQII